MMKFLILVLILVLVRAEFDHVNIAFYFNKSSQKSQQLYNLSSTESLLNEVNYNVKLKTLFYIHGFKENSTTESTQTVIDAYLKRNDYNVIVLNWGPYANGSYVTHAVPNVVKIGKLVGSLMHEWLNKEVFELNELHIVGHSLGAHLGGYISRAVSTLSKYKMKIRRLTGLDPALPLFYPKMFFFPTAISADDACFVDIIHSDAGSLGAPNATGSVDFWPNGGLEQPGCRNSSEPHCNHCRSWHFWSESLEEKFFAIKCENFEEFKQNKCDGNTIKEMGINSQSEISGNFFLQTNSKTPFSLGIDGTHFQEQEIELI